LKNNYLSVKQLQFSTQFDMKKFRSAFTIIICLTLVISTSRAQQLSQPTMVKLTALRADFVKRITALGYKHSLKLPPVILDNPRSFGNYDDSTNTLHTGYWPTFPKEGRVVFAQLAKNSGMPTEKFFELVVHQWIFVHELGHWWRACQHVTADPYENEKAANRIAAAYWNDRDPAFYKFIVKVFTGVVDHMPSPVPAGHDKEKYLNENYQKLPGGAAYSWYQSIMNVEIGKEKPFETFKQAVVNAGKPLK
jgi:hypothetical protein